MTPMTAIRMLELLIEVGLPKRVVNLVTCSRNEAEVGYPVGGGCPFGIDKDIPVYLDVSLKRFDTVFPSAGSANSAIELSCDELFRYSNALEWVDVCKL